METAANSKDSARHGLRDVLEQAIECAHNQGNA
jgi:hypothetical protein